MSTPASQAAAMPRPISRPALAFAFSAVTTCLAGAAAAQDWALEGYDPVGFQDQGRAVPGRADIHTMWKGNLWLFANDQHRLAFESNPRAYVPGFDGLCPVALSDGREEKGDPRFFVVIGDRLYLTRSDSARHTLMSTPRDVLNDARRHFAATGH
ncbi:MAG: YHS domain-containing (seleno)protein [Paracoccus sp. (in: a-proteobacteria)]|uniref:YHS domain-containing (seleno)protein n=1 Tax=Paracoccus sp. TaxID=267 RepID=UPI0026DFEDE8|nr:YHS domain-containing (seleno)protein [Paracoccus sp. (in: a-proteobacteria)]MDO5613174.1 YHS domain-containing (seleno)protein [Paracoccus sp. (in: a-proteobacteria)]